MSVSSRLAGHVGEVPGGTEAEGAASVGVS